MIDLQNIPNARWLGLGILFTLGLSFLKRHFPWWMHLSLVLGAGVSCVFLMFHNPKTQANRLDLAICVPFLAIMWPIPLFAMLVAKPWNDKKWKNRNSSEQSNDDSQASSDAD